MANGQINHPEPLERHPGNVEEDEENQENLNVGEEHEQDEVDDDVSTSEQDECLDVEDIMEQDYLALDQTLDQIDSCLDQLDQKNDDLNAKLKELLAASRQEYEELTSARLARSAGSGDDQGPQDSC